MITYGIHALTGDIPLSCGWLMVCVESQLWSPHFSTPSKVITSFGIKNPFLAARIKIGNAVRKATIEVNSGPTKTAIVR